MRTTSFFALAGTITAAAANPFLHKRAACNSDLCLRSVAGTNVGLPPAATRSADCSSFQRVTVTPAAATSTTTVTPGAVTVSETVTVTAATVSQGGTTVFQAKRQATVTASSVPAYASPCSGGVRYASACSCYGITRTTVTASVPTTYVTETATPATNTLTVTSSVTVTVSPTTTVRADRLPCGSTIHGAGPCGCDYTITCDAYPGEADRLLGQVSNVSEGQCVDACDGYAACQVSSYYYPYGDCYLFGKPIGNTKYYTGVDMISSSKSNCQGLSNPLCKQT